MHWVIFGSSGHASKPPGGVLRSYHRCLPLRHAQHQLVKSIMRPGCAERAEGPHHFKLNCSGVGMLQTDGTPIDGPKSEQPVHQE